MLLTGAKRTAQLVLRCHEIYHTFETSTFQAQVFLRQAVIELAMLLTGADGNAQLGLEDQ